MKKIILMGRSECGKTTLRQALKGDTLHYHKTQYVNHFDVVIDTPGEYAETNRLGYALALYSYEADVVGLVDQRGGALFPVSAEHRGPVHAAGHRDRDPDRRAEGQSGSGGAVASALRLRDGFPGEFLYGRRDLADPRIPERTGGRVCPGTRKRQRNRGKLPCYENLGKKTHKKKAAAAVFFLCPLVDSETPA